MLCFSRSYYSHGKAGRDGVGGGSCREAHSGERKDKDRGKWKTALEEGITCVM